jgi:tetratricopeptide (TPR) repeat protein
LAKRRKLRQRLSTMAASASNQSLESQIQALIQKHKYAQAVRKLEQALQRDPHQSVPLSEADIWLLKGQHEVELTHYPQAEQSLQMALSLGLTGDTHYWLARCWLNQHQPDKAVTLFQTAFDDKTLPKDLGGCYLKLLFLTDHPEVVEALIKTQAKRFYAPHLHWARGVLALQSEDPETALTHFKKMGRPASPGDQVMVWEAYACQQVGDWDQAATKLGLDSLYQRGYRFGPLRQALPRHPARQQLALVQAASTQQSLSELFDLDTLDSPERQAAMILQLLHFIDQEDFHNAAHVLLNSDPQEMTDYAELLQGLFRPLMLLAGKQARQEQELNCTETFWSQVVNEPTFDPQLAINLHHILDLTGSHRENYDLLQKLLKWVQKDAKQQPQAWPDTRLQPTLAKLYCWLADNQMILGRYREAERSVREAARLAPEHPDVIGRQGLSEFADGEFEKAIPLLTQALAKGCRFQEVYGALLKALEEIDDKATAKEVRRKYGKQFGDLGVETEVDVPDWVEALSFHSYALLEETAENANHPSPALQMLQIFVSAATEKSESSDKITLKQTSAQRDWDEALRSHSPLEQVSMLKAICLAIQLYARRNKKGITALQNRYHQQLFQLGSEVPAAFAAHLVIHAVKLADEKHLAGPVTHFLDRAPQPGNALAKVQLEARRFGPTRVLLPYLEICLQQEPQNPLLLLAKATCLPRHSLDYKQLYDQGFELARRLQDAEALQAFREEDWFQTQSTTRKVLGPNLNSFSDPSQLDMRDILRRMAKEMFGQEVPPEILEQILPQIEAHMAAEFLDEEDEDEDFDFFSMPPWGRSRKSSKKRKPWYQI